jgi:hypothetical protein
MMRIWSRIEIRARRVNYGRYRHLIAPNSPELNDDLRRHLHSGVVVMTPGIAAFGEEAIGRLANAIATFDDFCTANDPHGEHDFGAFDFDGTPVMFKIDYCDKSLTFHSPDPADPSVTERIITIMLAEEY